jgi:hypothetical protein
VRCPSTIPTAGRPLRIPRTLHVHHLQDNIVSAAQVALHNYILFQGSKVHIIQPSLTPEPSKILSTGRRNQVVYELDARPQQAAFISNIAHPFKIPRAYANLHNTFNHKSARKILNLIKANPTLRPSIQSPLKSAIQTVFRVSKENKHGPHSPIQTHCLRSCIASPLISVSPCRYNH